MIATVRRWAARPRLGLGVASDRVSAVLLRGGVVQWSASRTRDEGTPLSESLRAVFAACPRTWPIPPIVTAAVGPAASQLKRVAGVPPFTEPRALAELVRENVGRFFLRNGVPLVISGARIESPGCLWIAAFDAPVVEAIDAACRDVGLPLRAFVPTVVALRYAAASVERSAIEWTDGAVRLIITYGANGPTSVRRVRKEDEPAPSSTLAASPLVLGDRAVDVAADVVMPTPPRVCRGVRRSSRGSAIARLASRPRAADSPSRQSSVSSP